jgi:hypothetical protein
MDSESAFARNGKDLGDPGTTVLLLAETGGCPRQDRLVKGGGVLLAGLAREAQPFRGADDGGGEPSLDHLAVRAKRQRHSQQRNRPLRAGVFDKPVEERRSGSNVAEVVRGRAGPRKATRILGAFDLRDRFG